MLKLHRSSAISCLSALVAGTLLATRPQAAPAKAAAKPAKGPEIFRTTCIGCHSVNADGRMPRLDGVRATPEEWDNIMRRMGRRGYVLSATERKAAVKQITKHQSLTPDENAAIGYLAVSPAANIQESIPSPGQQADFKQTCVSCHSYAKIASHRRSPDSWSYIHDFHLGSFTAALTQSYRDMHWSESAKMATKGLAKSLPFDSADWRAWQQQRGALNAGGTWIVTGHEPMAGDYEARMTLIATGDDDYTLTRAVTYADGRKDTLTGKATLYGGGALRCEWPTAGRAVTASYTIGLPGKGLQGQRIELVGSWQTAHEQHLYGQERGSRLRTQTALPTVLRLSPAWVTPGQGKVEIIATTNGPAPSQWHPLPADAGVTFLSRRNIDATHIGFTMNVGPKARLGALSLTLGAAHHEGDKPMRMDDRIIVAKGIDYIRVTPERAVARLGGIKVPKDGVPFEVMGYSNGPDGIRHTDDDVALAHVPATWSMQEYYNDFEDDEITHIGTLTPSGLFMPANEAAYAKSYTGDHTGNAWIVATHTPTGRSPLHARAYLNVSAPDMVKLIR
ncbi:MAG: quinohemoprotein amine dehydrogenase subunit alpha [Candidatus Sericytochromatia bacterium]|nr:quinohemoprotein amine dehydrogenase subunit alpha [Candidatus Sericytochromatia bacterium]